MCPASPIPSYLSPQPRLEFSSSKIARATDPNVHSDRDTVLTKTNDIGNEVASLNNQSQGRLGKEDRVLRLGVVSGSFDGLSGKLVLGMLKSLGKGASGKFVSSIYVSRPFLSNK